MNELNPDQAEAIVRGLASAVRHDGALTETQTNLLAAVGRPAAGRRRRRSAQLEPITPAELADGAPGPGAARPNAVHGMVALEIVAQPVPPEVHDQVAAFA